MREVPLLRSPLLPEPFVHGFTLRQGGSSSGPYATLNLGGKWGDDPECVAENRRRVLGAVGLHRLFTPRQVHGNAVTLVGPDEDEASTAAREADGICSSRAGVAVGVHTADCVPLLLGDPETGAFAAVHAGWRGAVARVASAAVAKLAELGARPEGIRVALGPAIGPCCFEVGEEVAAAFASRHVDRSRGKPRVDLRAALAAELREAGVSAIDASPLCTRCDPERFFSYRRDGQRTGQHLALIGRRA